MGTMLKRNPTVFGAVVIGMTIVGLTGCSPTEIALPPEATEPDTVVIASPEPTPESAATIEARACFEGSWVADNPSFAAIMFEAGAIAKAKIRGTWRITAEGEGMVRSEFVDWSYDVNMPGPIGSPMTPRTITDNSTTIGNYIVRPDGTIEATFDPEPADDSSDKPKPIVFTCAGDTLSQDLLEGTVTHTRQS